MTEWLRIASKWYTEQPIASKFIPHDESEESHPTTPMFSPATTTLFAYTVLGILAFVLISMAVIMNRRSRLTPLRSLIYVYGYLTARFIWRAEVPNSFPDIGSNGAILVCNHRCPFDPMMMQLIAPRLVRWMVAREYCESPGLKWYFRLAKSIPVSRAGIDTASTRAAIRAAQSGDLVGLFPGRPAEHDRSVVVAWPARGGIDRAQRASSRRSMLHL